MSAATSHISTALPRPLALSLAPNFVPADLLEALLAEPSSLGPELPGLPSHNPALPPAPSLAELLQLAETAPVRYRYAVGSGPANIHNAHYGNHRAQLAFALTHDYNSVEGDVRVRGGRAVMQHNVDAAYDLTFEQWATIVFASGKHLRIDVKDAAALPEIEAVLAKLGVPDGQVTFNLAVYAPWSSADVAIEAVAALHARHRASWITLNQPVPGRFGSWLAARAAKALGPTHLGIALMPETADADEIASLRTVFEAVNVWNIPELGGVRDAARSAQWLRSIGANGMLDLRTSEDPLAKP